MDVVEVVGGIAATLTLAYVIVTIIYIDKKMNYVMEAFKKMDRMMEEEVNAEFGKAPKNEDPYSHIPNEVREAKQKEIDEAFFKKYEDWRVSTSVERLTAGNMNTKATFTEEIFMSISDEDVRSTEVQFQRYLQDCKAFKIKEDLLDRYEYHFFLNNMTGMMPPPIRVDLKYELIYPKTAKYLPNPFKAAEKEFEIKHFGEVLK